MSLALHEAKKGGEGKRDAESRKKIHASHGSTRPPTAEDDQRGSGSPLQKTTRADEKEGSMGYEGHTHAGHGR